MATIEHTRAAEYARRNRGTMGKWLDTSQNVGYMTSRHALRSVHGEGVAILQKNRGCMQVCDEDIDWLLFCHTCCDWLLIMGTGRPFARSLRMRKHHLLQYMWWLAYRNGLIDWMSCMGCQRIYGDEIPPGYRICSMPVPDSTRHTHRSCSVSCLSTCNIWYTTLTEIVNQYIFEMNNGTCRVPYSRTVVCTVPSERRGCNNDAALWEGKLSLIDSSFVMSDCLYFDIRLMLC